MSYITLVSTLEKDCKQVGSHVHWEG